MNMVHYLYKIQAKNNSNDRGKVVSYFGECGSNKCSVVGWLIPYANLGAGRENGITSGNIIMIVMQLLLIINDLFS